MPIFEMKEGRYTSVTSAQYHSVKKCVGSTGIEHIPASKSTLTSFIEDPDTWKRGISFKQSRSMDMGSYIDALCLEPEVLKTEFAVTPKTYISTAAKTKGKELKWNGNARPCQDWKEAQGGKTIITPTMEAQARIAQESLMSNKYTRAAIEGSDTQVAYVVDHHGIFSKSLFDMCPREGSMFEDAIVDMKRTVGFSPREFKYEILKYKYHWQAAMYLDAHNKVTGENRKRFYFVLSNSNPPFNAGIVEIPTAMIELGRKQYKEALDKFIHCTMTNHWPSPYGEGPVMIEWSDEQ